MPTQIIKLKIQDDPMLIRRVSEAARKVHYLSVTPIIEKELATGNNVIVKITLETKKERAERLIEVIRSWNGVRVIEGELTVSQYC